MPKDICPCTLPVIVVFSSNENGIKVIMSYGAVRLTGGCSVQREGARCELGEGREDALYTTHRVYHMWRYNTTLIQTGDSYHQSSL